MRKRRVVSWIVLALALMLVLACLTTASAAEKFNWKKYSGTKIRLLLNKHPYTEALLGNLKTFENLTGIKVEYDIFPEQNYFDKVTIDLSSGSGSYDVFMTGAYQVWQYAPPGWMEPLEPYINDPSMTNPDYDWEDIYPNLRKSDQWNLKPGNPLGSGHQWAIPWGFEANALMYRVDMFKKYGIAVPESLPALYATAKKLNNIDGSGIAGIVVRGSKNWATIHPGFMTQYASYGARDFDDKLNAVMNSPKAVEMTDLWVKMVREAGPKAWTTYTWYQAGSDFGAGKAAMLFDADILGYFQNVPGASACSGKIGWAPGPKGPEGKLVTNMWIWSLAMSAKSKNKGAAWYFMQWATGKEHLTKAAVDFAMVDPVRKSIWENPKFIAKMKENYHFYETFQAIIDNCSILFTPQPKFFETTTEWAATLHDIYYGEDAKKALDKLVAKINRMMTQAGIRKP
ncbi:MAG TPA: sugar ABC transporter substrate-binding protein [Firmicutes bacterium]|nr:sugar ABC transporter substrate-binding protein [Bacillota bacterium]